MNGPSGELWANIIRRKNRTSTAIMGIIHHILFSQRKEKSRPTMENLTLTAFQAEIKKFMNSLYQFIIG